jgi:excisionase family DNA binding protein
MNPKTKNLVRDAIGLLAQAGAVTQKEFNYLTERMEGACPVLMTRAEAASTLNISSRTVMRLMKSGILPTVKTTSTAVRIPRESVMAFAQTGIKGGA